MGVIHEAGALRRAGEEYGEIRLTPRKAYIRVTHFGLAWDPRSGLQ